MSLLPNTRICQIVSRTNPVTFRSGDIDLGQVSRVHLKTVIIPNTEFNVNSKTSKIVITSADMTPISFVPLGQYTSSAYLDALAIVLSDAGPFPFTVTQDPNTFKITFTNAGGTEFTIEPSGSSRLTGQHKSKTSIGLVLDGDSIPDFSGMRLVVFQSYTLGKFKISSSVDSKIVKTVVLGSEPMTASFGGVLKVEQTEETLDSHYFNGYHNCANFDMLLTDENSQPLELNGCEWILEFEMHCKGST